MVCMTDTYIAASTLLSHTGAAGNNPGWQHLPWPASRRTSNTATTIAGVNAEIRTAVGGLPASVVLTDSRAGHSSAHARCQVLPARFNNGLLHVCLLPRGFRNVAQ